MIITNEPLAPDAPVKFKVSGFPEEAAVRAAVERFYGLKPEADRRFLIDNAFNELIFSGAVGAEGKVEKLEFAERERKNFKPVN